MNFLSINTNHVFAIFLEILMFSSLVHHQVIIKFADIVKIQIYTDNLVLALNRKSL